MDSATPSSFHHAPKDCVHYLRTGSCRYGANCRFNHPGSASSTFQQVISYPSHGFQFPERIGQPDCQFYLKTGTCKFGVQCRYHHPRVKAGSPRGPPLFNSQGLPLRPAEKECAFYLRTGCCKFGVACKFHHPERPGSIGAVCPNHVAASPASAPSWTITSPLQFHGSGLPPGQSPYMPFYTSTPPQSILYSGWNSYQSNGTLPPTNGDQRGLYNSPQPYVGVGPGMDGSSNYVQRPEQPECQYYMQTGHCKFGVNCRYYHPTSVAISLVSATLSPMGLPLRPGQPLCTYYLKNGICKFGPVCRFDHPIREPSASSSVSPTQYPSKEPVKADEFVPPSVEANNGNIVPGEPLKACQNDQEGS